MDGKPQKTNQSLINKLTKKLITKLQQKRKFRRHLTSGKIENYS